MSWRKVKLGEFLRVRDNRYKPNDKAIKNLQRIDKIDFSGKIFISDKPSNTDMILVKKGDLVISGINVEKGAMAVYTGEEDITATIHYSSYSFDETKTDIEFLKSFLKSIEFKNALKEQVPGGIKTEIKPKHLLPLIVEIPTDIKEQKAVVKLLQGRNSKVDEISLELTHQLSLVKKLRQQLLQDAVQGKLVPQNKKDEPAGELLKKIKAEKVKLFAEKKLKKEKELPPIKPDEIPFEIPENWIWCRGEIIANYIDPQPSHRTPAESADGVPYIAMSDIKKDGSIDFNFARKVSKEILVEHQKRYKLENGDFVFGKIGTIGKPVKLPSPFNYTLSANVILIQPIRKLINHDYLFYFLSSPTAEKNLIENKSTTSYPVFGMGKARNMPIPLPPLAEQIRVVQKIAELMQYCNDLEVSIKQSESQNEKLLQQVLREALRKEPVEA